MDLQVHISTEKSSKGRMHRVGSARNGVCVGGEDWVRGQLEESEGLRKKK